MLKEQHQPILTNETRNQKVGIRSKAAESARFKFRIKVSVSRCNHSKDREEKEETIESHFETLENIQICGNTIGMIDKINKGNKKTTLINSAYKCITSQIKIILLS